MTSLDPEAAALRDRAIAPVLEAIEACEIEQAWTAVEIEHARSLHPSSKEIAQMADDLAAYDRGERWLYVDELPVPCDVKIDGDWMRYEGTIGHVLVVFPEGCAAPQYTEWSPAAPIQWRSV